MNEAATNTKPVKICFFPSGITDCFLVSTFGVSGFGSAALAFAEKGNFINSSYHNFKIQD
jgi:hypothetical protein